MKKISSVPELFSNIRKDIRDYKERILGSLSRQVVSNLRSGDKDIPLDVREFEDGLTIKSKGQAPEGVIAKRHLLFAEAVEKIDIDASIRGAK